MNLQSTRTSIYRRVLALVAIVPVLVAMTLTARSAHAGQVAPVLRRNLDIAGGKVGFNQVWTAIKDSRGRAVRGQGVLVGLVDSGIDYHNADFKNPNGTTRIKYIWDQTGKGKAPAGFTFGNECTSASINNGSCAERDIEGHGTHVAGIAAGNGRSSNPAKYVGAADQSDIAVVKLRGTAETDLVDGCRYLIRKAQQLHEPVVINLSLGNDREPHDGSGTVGKAFNSLTGPGRIIMAAAGNESSRAGHASGVLRQGQTVDVKFNAKDAVNGTLYLYYPSGDTVTSSITDEETGQQFGVDPNGDVSTYRSEDGIFRVATQLTRKDARWTNLTVLIVGSRQPASGQFDLTLKGDRVSSSDRFNVWSGGSHIQFVNPDRYTTLTTPGDVKNVISVANYTTRISYQDLQGQTIAYCTLLECPSRHQSVGSLDGASSWGPTVDGRQQPDVAAPGGLIISSRSADIPTCESARETSCLAPQLLVNGGRNLVSAGTSMASPMVAGTVALMLQVNPKLNAQKVRSILRTTARHDSFTGKAAWSAQWGAGKLNALAAVRSAKSGS